jgi:predicted DNA-binding transcriptional regulator AlpA
MSSDPTPAAAPTPDPPGLLRRVDAARFCSVGVSTWDRWTAAGWNPAPVKKGGAVLWSRDELAEWQRHRGPPRDRWSAVWQSILSTRRACPQRSARTGA